jgi:phage terminase large subunit GpA-like protein
MPVGNFWSAFEPAPDIGIAEYSIRRIFNEEGRPFDFLAFPWLVACGGPMDSFDSLVTREIALQWGSRLGKTFFVLCGSIFLSDLAPCNQMLAGNAEDLGLQQTERVRQMGMQIPSLVSAGIEKTLKRRLRFGGNTIYAAWSKSPVTLSNVNILYGGASELDLWERMSTSKHPDPEAMFRDRFKDNDSLRKVVFESIPTLKGTYEDEHGVEKPRSRIEAKRLEGSDCQFHVGCPHCGGYQVLTVDRVSDTGYECEHCDKVISDEYRKVFIRTGVWVPRGCTVDPLKAKTAAKNRLDSLEAATELPDDDPAVDDIRKNLHWGGWSECDYIVGEPDNDCELETYQLSSLYALSLTWRRINQEKSDSQNFVNQWLAETYEPPNTDEIDVDEEAKVLAPAIIGELPRNTLPDWCKYRILTCDRQKRTFPWMITAWDEEIERSQIIDSGVALSFTEVEQLLKRKWGNDGITLMLIDSGYLSSETYDWCLGMTSKSRIVYPVKGDKASVVKHHYKLFEIEDEKGRKSTYRKIKRVHINTQSTQEWTSRLLEERKLLKLWNDKAENHHGLCVELLNDFETTNQVTSRWDRILTTKPNDQRDNLRYAYVGAQLARQLGLGDLVEESTRRDAIGDTGGFIRKKKSGSFIRRRT